jgi:spore coat protein CotH
MKSHMSNENRRSALWITMTQAALLGLAAGLSGYLLLTTILEAPARAQGPGAGGFQGPPPFGPGGFGGGERKIVSQFDKNSDGRLDTAERKAARASLAAEPAGRGFGRRGGPGGFGRGGMAPGSPGPKVKPADVKSYPNAPLYDTGTLRTVFLQFENADWEQELAAFNNTDVEVPAVAVIDGKTYKDVGVHFRGASSYMMVPEGSKRSLNLSFDFVDKKQVIDNYRTMNLLNANGDPTFVRAVVYSEIARQYIPAPKANYMRVVINGESWGIYVNAQQFNSDFTRDYFKSTKGARWKVPGRPGGRGGMEYIGEDVAAYKRLYEIKTKDDAKSWADLIKLFRVLSETPAEKLEAALGPIFDIDGALKFLALDVALVNSDGYWTRASDYSIYQDEKGRFHVIPHDMNEGLADEGGRGFGPPRGFGPGGPGGPDGPGGPGRGGPPPPDGMFGPGPGRGGRGMFGGATADLDPLVGLDDTTKPLRSKLLAVAALRERYLSYVRDIAQKHLDWKTLGPRVQQLQALIAEDVKVDTRKLYSTEAFKAETEGDERSLKNFVEKRRAYLMK